MPPLAPTVHESLARCGERVFVDGLVTGADVVLSVDGVEFALSAVGASHNFVVPPLAAGAIVNAKRSHAAPVTVQPLPQIANSDRRFRTYSRHKRHSRAPQLAWRTTDENLRLKFQT
jgi:hypothetical protein